MAEGCSEDLISTQIPSENKLRLIRRMTNLVVLSLIRRHSIFKLKILLLFFLLLI
jgi:hypothetical protein